MAVTISLNAMSGLLLPRSPGRSTPVPHPPGAQPRPPCTGCVLTALPSPVDPSHAPAQPQDAVVDTTGAGDSFIGSVLYGICTGMALPDTMRLAAVVAACKCTALGARPGLPTRQQLAPELLGCA